MKRSRSAWLALATVAFSCDGKPKEAAEQETDVGNPRSWPGVDSGEGRFPRGDTATLDTGETATEEPDTGPVYDCATPLEICTDAACSFSGDARVVTIRGDTLLNGSPVVDDGEVRFRDIHLGYIVDVPLSGDSFFAAMPAGDYEVTWSPSFFGSETVEAHAHGDTTVSFDTERVEVAVTTTWSGEVVPGAWGVSFRSVGESYGAAGADHSGLLALVAEGTYDVHLGIREADFSGGRWSFLAASDVLVEGPLTLAFDARPATLSGEVTLSASGGPIEVTSVEAVDGAGYSWPDRATDGAFALRIPEGVHDVWVDYEGEPGEDVEEGTFRVDVAVPVAGDVTAAWDGSLHQVSGSLSVEGLDLTDDETVSRCPQLVFTETSTGGLTRLYCPGGESFTLALPGGTYDLELVDGGVTLPLAQDVVVAEDLMLDLAATLHPVSGTLLYDGGEPPYTGGEHATQSWEVTFQREDGDEAYVYEFEGTAS